MLWENNPDFCENAFPPIEIKRKCFFREIANYRLDIINLHLSQTYGFFSDELPQNGQLTSNF